MKHLLNNLSEEEKNAIRSQHTGGMNVVTENFSRLLNNKLGNVKPLISEQSLELETPSVIKGAVKSGIKSTSDIAKSAFSHTKNDPSVYNDPKGENSGIVYSVKEVTPGKFRIFVKTVKYPEPTDAATVFLSPRDEKFKDYSSREEAQKVIDHIVPNQAGM
jgi:hypothetical protein